MRPLIVVLVVVIIVCVGVGGYAVWSVLGQKLDK